MADINKVVCIPGNCFIVSIDCNNFIMMEVISRSITIINHLKKFTMNISRITGSRNLLSKLVTVSALGIISIIACAAVLVTNADFSGEWKLNESKSNLGQFGRAARKLKIEGSVESMAIQRALTNQAGEEVTSNEKLTFDDKESESTVFGSAKKKSKAKWSDDGKKLTVKSTIAFERNGETMEIKSTEVWSLSEDGKTLTIETESTSSFGTNNTKLVYDKAG